MSSAQGKLKRIALLCMTPVVDSHEHEGAELPSYGIHRILAAVVNEPALCDVETRLFDFECDDPDQYVSAVVAFDPQVVGVSLFVWSAPCLIEVARRIRAKLPDCLIVFGGPSARSTFLDLPPYRNAADYVDAVVTRDGEHVFCEIAQAAAEHSNRSEARAALSSIAGIEIPTLLGWQYTGVRQQLKNLDAIASPYQMGLMQYGAVGYLESFRGCPMSCTFCEWGAPDISHGAFSEDYLTRELEALAAHDVPAVFNVDAGLNLDAHAFRNLAIAERNVRVFKDTQLWCEIYPARITDEHLQFLSECGPSYLGIGLQSVHTDVLKRLQRPFGRERFETAIEQLAQIAERVEVQIIFGLPTDSVDGFQDTLSYALSLPVTVRVYHCLVLPDALLTRGRAEWKMVFDHSTLSMISCDGWSEDDVQETRRLLAQETTRCGGTSGQFWWSFPPPVARQSPPVLPNRHFNPSSTGGAQRSA
jgi:radical SAM superfamily enzyme YgiQ (UPF0313 family)